MLLEAIREDFVGLSTEYPTPQGRLVPRHYLDSAASTLMMGVAQEVGQKFLQHYANTHSATHFAAEISTEAMRWAFDRILDFVGADKDEYTCVVHGSGVTGCANYLARTLQALRPERPRALVSLMEHHSNDLPYRRHSNLVEHISLTDEADGLGSLCLDNLAKKLEEHAGKVNFVSLTGVSNVTGIINPIHEAAELAHKAGAYVIVDGAQMVAHMPVRLKCHEKPERDIDCFMFSGHKIYAPGSPGVLVIKKALLRGSEPAELGGGIVEDVYRDTYRLTEQFPDRMHAGTPNIVGCIVLASVLEVLDQIGMDNIFRHERSLTEYALKRLREIPLVKIYGHPETGRFPRISAISFNLKGFDHGFVAAVLNDYHNVSVRSGCFCAHPYARELLTPELWELDMSGESNPNAEFKVNLKRGMVRASFGLYTTHADIDALAEGLSDIAANSREYLSCYKPQGNGTYRLQMPNSRQNLAFEAHRTIQAALASRIDPAKA